MASKSTSKKQETFEESLKELENILSELENPNIALSDLVEKFERAKECMSICKKKLDDAELSIKKMSNGSTEDFFLE